MKKLVYFAFCLLLALPSCSRPKDLVYREIKNFGVSKAGQETQISMDVNLYNPNAYRMKLKDADLNILINGNPMGKISMKECIAIPKLDTFSLPVNIRVNLQSVFPNALQILFNRELNLKLEGKLKVSRHGIYISIPVDYESKQDLRSFF